MHNPYIYTKDPKKPDPITFILDENNRISVVTGHQGSGKSTLSQTVGWSIILAQIRIN